MGYELYWFVFSIFVFLIISLALNVVFLFRFIWKDEDNKSRKIVQNISLALFTFLATLVLLELFFKSLFCST